MSYTPSNLTFKIYRNDQDTFSSLTVLYEAAGPGTYSVDTLDGYVSATPNYTPNNVFYVNWKVRIFNGSGGDTVTTAQGMPGSSSLFEDLAPGDTQTDIFWVYETKSSTLDEADTIQREFATRYLNPVTLGSVSYPYNGGDPPMLENYTFLGKWQINYTNSAAGKPGTYEVSYDSSVIYQIGVLAGGGGTVASPGSYSITGDSYLWIKISGNNATTAPFYGFSVERSYGGDTPITVISGNLISIQRVPDTDRTTTIKIWSFTSQSNLKAKESPTLVATYVFTLAAGISPSDLPENDYEFFGDTEYVTEVIEKPIIRYQIPRGFEQFALGISSYITNLTKLAGLTDISVQSMFQITNVKKTDITFLEESIKFIGNSITNLIDVYPYTNEVYQTLKTTYDSVDISTIAPTILANLDFLNSQFESFIGSTANSVEAKYEDLYTLTNTALAFTSNVSSTALAAQRINNPQSGLNKTLKPTLINENNVGNLNVIMQELTTYVKTFEFISDTNTISYYSHQTIINANSIRNKAVELHSLTSTINSELYNVAAKTGLFNIKLRG